VSLTVSPATVSLLKLACTPAIIVAGTSSYCTTNLSGPAPASGVTVSLTSSNLKLTVPVSLPIPAGATSASFAATAQNRFFGSSTVVATLQGSSVNAIITAGSRKTTQTVAPSGTTNLAQFTVRPADQTSAGLATTASTATTTSSVLPTELFCLPKQLQAGDTFNCEVQLSSPNLKAGTDLTVSASDPLMQVPAVISPRPGQSTLSFAATVSPQAQTNSTVLAVSLASASAPDTVQVNAKPTPVLTVPGRQLAIYGSKLSFNVTAASGLGATLYLSAPNLPSGAFFNGGSGAFAWTPNSSQKGSWTISFSAIDLHGNTATKTVSIEVGDGRPKIERVVQAAGNASGLVCIPGSLAAIYGTWLSSSVASDPTGGSITLAGTKVSFGGTYAAVVYAAPTELIVVCPAVTSASVTVETSSGRSLPVNIQIQDRAPGIFTVDGSGKGQASASIQGGFLIAAPRNYLYAAEPAQPGDQLAISVTGLDPNTSFPISAKIGDLTVAADWIKPVAGWAGVMEVGITIPAAAQTGDTVSLVLQQARLNGTWVISNSASIAIEAVRR
jgi:uncharacterized protein (TIGR03437 family)